MRIIAGRHRGRRLLGPVGRQTTRPITDRVKTSLFDALSAADRLRDAAVLDIFAGTGSMGLECLSRGAAHVTFVERDREALSRLRRNLEMIDELDRSDILAADALSAALVNRLRRRLYTLVFIDPPYAMWRSSRDRIRLTRQMDRLAEACTADAILIARTEPDVEISALDLWETQQVRQMGTMKLHQLRQHRDSPAAGEEAALHRPHQEDAAP